MARQIKAFSHGAKQASPYEPWHTKKSPKHREHRSRKGRHYVIRKDKIDAYKRKLEELKIKELEYE